MTQQPLVDAGMLPASSIRKPSSEYGPALLGGVLRLSIFTPVEYALVVVWGHLAVRSRTKFRNVLAVSNLNAPAIDMVFPLRELVRQLKRRGLEDVCSGR